MWTLYNLLLTLTAPFWLPWMLWRAHKRGEKPNWKERQGDYRDAIPKKGDRPRLWVHAVSVGEVVAVQPLLRELRKVLPKHEIVLSVTTSSGHRTARETAEGLYDYLVYLPIDVARFTLAAMQRVRPDALIVMETELWMNLFWAARTFDTKIFVVNARLSDCSFPRAKKVGFFYRALFGMVDGVLAQSGTDAERFRELGATNVETSGNLKFDQALEGLDDTTDWREELGIEDHRPVVVVGSLRQEEFDEIQRVIRMNGIGQWIIAPRHLETLPVLIQVVTNAATVAEGQLFRIGRRSQGTSGEVILLDTYGELARVYGIADVVVVGGSFKRLGGQNIIQPLAWGKPVLHGPYMTNFRDVATLSERVGASMVCANADELNRKLYGLLNDPARCAQMGQAAKALVEANRGASKRMAYTIASRLKP